MMTRSTSSIKHKRMLFAVLFLSLLCAAIAVGLANKKLSQRQTVAKPTAALNPSAETRTADHLSTEPLPQTSAQFDVSRNVIAGGGGPSSGGSLKVEGTIGQPAVGTTMSNGQFSQTGGFWQTESGTTPTVSTVQFSAASYSVGESDQRVTLTVTRSGDTSSPASVAFATSDLAGSQNCNVITGVASSRCDYETSIGAIKFAGGETSKAVSIFIVDDSYLEGTEAFTVSLSNPSGAFLGAQSTATVAINDNEISNGVNPIDSASFFVRLHYLDFLNREPDSSGLNFWTNEIISCGANAQCIECAVY